MAKTSKEFLVNVSRTVTFAASVKISAKDSASAIEKVQRLADNGKLGEPEINTSGCKAAFDPTWEEESDLTEAEEANVVEA